MNKRNYRYRYSSPLRKHYLNLEIGVTFEKPKAPISYIGCVKLPERLQTVNIPVGNIGINNLIKYKGHPRLRVFFHKGLKCVSCHREGRYLIKTVDPGGGYHIDLYTKDFHLMTIDHIHPKSKGGSNELDNLQPMCKRCNFKKGNKIIK